MKAQNGLPLSGARFAFVCLYCDSPFFDLCGREGHISPRDDASDNDNTKYAGVGDFPRILRGKSFDLPYGSKKGLSHEREKRICDSPAAFLWGEREKKDRKYVE